MLSTTVWLPEPMTVILVCHWCSVCVKSWSFCQKCRLLVTAKHTCTLSIWLCMKWCDMVHCCMVYTECTEMAAVLRGISHVRTKQCCNNTTRVDIQSLLLKAAVTHLESHATRVQWVCSRADRKCYIKATNSNNIFDIFATHSSFCFTSSQTAAIKVVFLRLSNFTF